MYSFSSQFYNTSIVSSSEEETSPVKVQEVADDKMAEGKDTTKEKKDNASKGKSVKDWTEDEVSMLTELLEERPRTWDVFNRDYSKRDVKDTAYKKKLAFLDVILLQSRAKSVDYEPNTDVKWRK